MIDRTRRRVLSGCGVAAAIAIAGCSSTGEDGDANQSPSGGGQEGQEPQYTADASTAWANFISANGWGQKRVQYFDVDTYQREIPTETAPDVDIGDTAAKFGLSAADIDTYLIVTEDLRRSGALLGDFTQQEVFEEFGLTKEETDSRESYQAFYITGEGEKELYVCVRDGKLTFGDSAGNLVLAEDASFRRVVDSVEGLDSTLARVSDAPVVNTREVWSYFPLEEHAKPDVRPYAVAQGIYPGTDAPVNPTAHINYQTSNAAQRAIEQDRDLIINSTMRDPWEFVELVQDEEYVVVEYRAPTVF